MTRTLALAAFLAAALPLCPAAGARSPADDKDDAAKKLNGTYAVTGVIYRGKVDDKKKDEVETVVIKDGEISIREKKVKQADTARFIVDPSKTPAHIDIMPGNNMTIPGIYELKESDKGTELTIAFVNDADVTDRPKDFKGEGKGEVVIKLLRKKEK